MGETEDQKIIKEIKLIAKADKLYERAIMELKSIGDWQTKPLCDKIISLSIEKGLLILKVGEAYRRGYYAIYSTEDCPDCFIYDGEDNSGWVAISLLEKVKENYSKYDCFSKDRSSEVDSLINAIKK